MHLFRPSLSFLLEAQPRLENRRGQKTLFGSTNYKAKITNSFYYLLIHINNFFNSVFLSVCQQN
jgi:hypothetical protein